MTTADGTRPVAALRTGRPGWISFAAVGVAWDKAKGQPNVTATMRVLNEDGRDALTEATRNLTWAIAAVIVIAAIAIAIVWLAHSLHPF